MPLLLRRTATIAENIRKKNAFDGVRSGKSKKLWINIPKQPASDPIAVERRNPSAYEMIVARPFRNKK